MAAQPDSVVIKGVDIPDERQQHAIRTATHAIASASTQQEAATIVKKEFDKSYGPYWHCIVGESFGSAITHESNGFIYFNIGTTAVLLYKAGN
mmetsp:Transcript_30071/g.75704  ORF Transcript_30071/g.75704 Transcript_30071/m.75704 type:complete len:93 (+) Transcript_30071:577-855(+)